MTLFEIERTPKEIADEDDEAMEIFLTELRVWMNEARTPEEIADWVRLYLDR